MRTATKILFGYHVLSAVFGVAVILILLIGQGAGTNVFGNLFLLSLYVPFVISAYGFMHFKRWAFILVLFLYGVEIIQVPPAFNLKLSLLHHSLMVSVYKLEFGIDIVSLAIFLLLLFSRQKYFQQSASFKVS